MCYVSKCMALFLFCCLSVSAEWVSFDGARREKQAPAVTVVSQDAAGIVIRATVSGFEKRKIASGAKTYQSIDLLTGSVIMQTGAPQVPYIAELIALPANMDAVIETVTTGEETVFRGVSVAPAPSPASERNHSAAARALQEDAIVYGATTPYPFEAAAISGPSILRDLRLVRLTMHPVRYVPAAKELRAVSSITVRIRYVPGRGGEIARPDMPVSPAFEAVYRTIVMNYDVARGSKGRSLATGRDVMLCITPDNMADTLKNYAAWKTMSGVETRIVKFSEIGATANNAAKIKDYIVNAYKTWPNPPAYALLVGDGGVFPVKISTATVDGDFGHESYFGQIDGNDYFPDVLIGRLPVKDAFSLGNMLGKLLQYERDPDTLSNRQWFKKGAVCANDAYPSQQATKQFTAERMRVDGGFFSVDTFWCEGGGGGIGHPGGVKDVIASINRGISFLNYRGEGWSEGWAATNYPFGVGDLNKLANKRMLPFVTSIGCGVSIFYDEEEGECFGEEWMRLGSAAAPRGACAFIGPTGNTHTAYNNWFDKGIYIGMFQEGLETPGQALLRGMVSLQAEFGADEMAEYQAEVFCVFGDPSLHVWKEVPRTVSAEHPATVGIGVSQLPVKITAASQPVKGARVTVTGQNVFASGVTEANGAVTISVDVATEQILTLVVTGNGVYPLQKTISSVSKTANVFPLLPATVDDITGNNDGLVNPNEQCKLSVALKNSGTQTCSQVKARLKAQDTAWVSIATAGEVACGDINAGAQTNKIDFTFTVKQGCPVGYLLPLTLYITSPAGNWDFAINVPVDGCVLQFHSLMVQDTGKAANLRLDPGEFGKIFITVRNTGRDKASNVSGIIATADPNIQIVDSVGSFGIVDTAKTAMSSPDCFGVKVSASCPVNYEAAFTVKLATNGGLYSYGTTLKLNLPIAVPNESDPTGPDSGGYYAYSSFDTLYKQYPKYAWEEISAKGTRLPADQFGMINAVVSLPFSFKYYGVARNKLSVSNDGWCALAETKSATTKNSSIPCKDNVPAMVAPFWAELSTQDIWGMGKSGDTGKVFYLSDAGKHRFIVQWTDMFSMLDSVPARNMSRRDSSGITFQAIFLDPAHYPTKSGNGEIVFQYKSIVELFSVPKTAGIENPNQDAGLQYVYNNAYGPTAHRLRKNFAIKFSDEKPENIGVGTDTPEKKAVPSVLTLRKAGLNSAGTAVTFRYSIASGGRVDLRLRSLNGRLVRTLVSGYLPQGYYRSVWDGNGDNGRPVVPGVYIYILRHGDERITGQMVKTK